jgi:hypothetical protein
MMFVIWSLIIRTCYQSTLYKNLQQDMRKPVIKTFEKLNEKNFTIFLNHGLTLTLVSDELFKR